MHNNAELLSRLSSNAYEFDKTEMIRGNLRKSVVTCAKKIIKVNGTYIAEELSSSKRLFQENEIV